MMEERQKEKDWESMWINIIMNVNQSKIRFRNKEEKNMMM